jgi:hypothetical protein
MMIQFVMKKNDQESRALENFHPKKNNYRYCCLLCFIKTQNRFEVEICNNLQLEYNNLT